MENSQKKKIVLTGGHAATTAMATVQELVSREKKDHWEVYWIGVESAIEGKKIKTLESQIFPKMGVSTYTIIAGRIQRKFTFWTLPSLVKIPIGFLHAFSLLGKIKPDIILSFGGFAAFPVVFVGWLKQIPIVIHEQTSEVGRANALSSFFAKTIAASRESSLKHFHSDKVVITGNPVLTQVAQIPPKTFPGNPPTIFICGGSRGSQSINELVSPILDKLTSKYYVIHQTGVLGYKKFTREKKKNYEVYDLIDPREIDGIYKRADIILARAGANTVSEIMATKRPAILIPFPVAYLNEQEGNALFAQKFGIAKMLKQDELTPEKLLTEIDKLLDSWNLILSRVKDKRSPDLEASKKLVDILEETLNK